MSGLMGRHQVEIKEGPNRVCERSGKPQVVFRGDQKTVVLKSFHWGSDVCMLRKSLFAGFHCPCHPHNSFTSYQEVSLHPCLFSCPRTHAAPGLLPACTVSSSAASLEQGEAAGGGAPLEELRNAGTFLYTSAHLPLALSHPSLAQSTNAFPATRNVRSALPCPVMPSTKVLSLETPRFI